MQKPISDDDMRELIHRAPNLGEDEMHRFYIGIKGPLTGDFGYRATSMR